MKEEMLFLIRASLELTVLAPIFSFIWFMPDLRSSNLLKNIFVICELLNEIKRKRYQNTLNFDNFQPRSALD